MTRGIQALMLSIAAVFLAGCETTMEKSARLEKEGAGLAKPEKIELTAANRDIEVVDKAILTDEYGTAVVLRVRNTGREPQIDVPIQIDVKDRKGKSIFRNDTEGLEDGLLNLQAIEPGEETWWVHDQVFPNGKPASVEVSIGTPEARAPDLIPKIRTTKPVLKVDPVSGIEVEGRAFNDSDIEQIDMLLYAVASKGNEVVAVGRGLIPTLKTGKKGQNYSIFFIGNPRGARVEVFATPNTFE